MNPWLPGFSRVDLDGQPHGGPYDDTSRPKLGWHTWEGFSWPSAEAAFRKYPPHVAVFPPWPGREKQVGRRQYVPLDRHAYAFAGSESDDEFVIQVEVAGKAAEMRNAPDVVLQWLAINVVAPIEAATHVPRVVVRFGFRDTGFLATPNSKIRLTPTELREFSGHLGHQHMPPPDHHWDPGALPIDRILNHLDDHVGDDDMTDEERLVLADAWVRDSYAIRNQREPKLTVLEKDVAAWAETIRARKATFGGVREFILKA